MVDISDLSIEDQREIELFQTWLARIDILIQSGIDRNKAQIEAYREIYYPEASLFDLFEETHSPEDEEIIEYLDAANLQEAEVNAWQGYSDNDDE